MQMDMMVLKVDFKKAYDTILWSFLFATMEKLGMPLDFINMLKFIFHDAESTVVINGEFTDPFSI
jgi:hypothetical protein